MSRFACLWMLLAAPVVLAQDLEPATEPDRAVIEVEPAKPGRGVPVMPAGPAVPKIARDRKAMQSQLEELLRRGLGEDHPVVQSLRKALAAATGEVKKIPLTPEMKAAVDRAIYDLASDDYHVRESAAQRLIEIGQPALASLQEASKSNDPEVRFRAEQLFAAVQSGVISDSRVLTGHEDIVWTVAYSNGGHLLASGGGGRHHNGQWSTGSDFAIRLWDPPTGRVIRTIEGHTSTVNRVVWSMSDRYLLSASSDGTARIWRVSSGTEFRVFRGHEGSVTHALFTADEKHVITAAWDKAVRIWEVASGKEVRKIDWPHGRVWGLDLSPDGSLLALCGDNPVIGLYQFNDGKLVGELRGHGNNAVTVAFSPDGTQLASGGWDNTARLWNVKDRAQLRQLADHGGRVEGLAWTRDGSQIVTACLDNKVRVFDAAKGTLVRAYEGHTQGVSKVAPSPLGDEIASASWDTTIRLWPTRGLAASGIRPPLMAEPVRVVPLPALRLERVPIRPALPR